MTSARRTQPTRGYPWHALAAMALGWLALSVAASAGGGRGSSVRNPQETRTLQSYRSNVGALAFAGDGSVLMTTSNSEEPSELIAWGLATGKPKTLHKRYSAFTRLAFSPDGKTIATADSDGAVLLWDAGTGRYLAEFEGHENSVEAIGFASDGRTLLTQSSDRTIKVWDVATRAEEPLVVRTIPPVECCAFTRDGKRAIYRSDDPDDTSVLNIREGTSQHLLLDGSDYHTLVVSADDRLLATGGTSVLDDATVAVWNIGSGRKLATLDGHTRRVRGLCFDSTGAYVASGADDGLAIIWDVRSGKQVFRSAGKGVARCLAFSPRGHVLALARDDDGVRLLDFIRGQDITPPR